MRAEISDHAVAKEVSVMRRGVGDNPAFLTPAIKSLAIYTNGINIQPISDSVHSPLSSQRGQ